MSDVNFSNRPSFIASLLSRLTGKNIQDGSSPASASTGMSNQHLKWLAAFYYCPGAPETVYPLDALDDEQRLAEFERIVDQRSLLNENTFPGPLFNAGHYMEALEAAEFDQPASGENAFLHWLGFGLEKRIVPIRYFDEDWYLARYHESIGEDRWAFEHYVFEGRLHPDLFRPTPWFNPRFFLQSFNEAIPPSRAYDRFLNDGDGIGGAQPIDGLTRWTLMRGEGYAPPVQTHSVSEIYRTLVDLTKTATGRRVADHADLLVKAFVREFYTEIAQLGNRTPTVEAFCHFVEQGLDNGLVPSPFFDPEVMSDAIGKPNDEPVFLQWLDHPERSNIIPTALFDSAWYVGRFGDGLTDRRPDFEHFIRAGVWAGNPPNRLMTKPRIGSFAKYKAPGLNFIYKYLVFSSLEPETSSIAQSVPSSACRKFPNGAKWLLSDVECYYKLEPLRRLMDVLDSPVFNDVLERATALDPKIGQSNFYNRMTVLPFTNRLCGAAEELRQRLDRSSYETIVTIPHCRISGAALVAGSLTRAITAILPNEKLLLVRTEASMIMRPEWFADDIDTVDASDILAKFELDDKCKLLLDLFIGVNPKRIFNVNSLTSWETLAKYGDRLKHWTHLYGYMFCYDVNVNGRKVGYPSMFFENTINDLSGLLFDNKHLKEDLCELYQAPEQVAAKIHPIYHSVPIEPWKTPHGRSLTERAKGRTDRPWRAIWGGRLDRQKRFDLIYEIAPALPDVEFWCWGKQVLEDVVYDFNALPPNVRFFGAYNSFEDLPLDECDFWLYTSQWDGVPSILIEIAMRGISTIASDVGGVGEIINEETGYPVKDALNPSAYVDTIRSLISNPEEAARRAENLWNLAKSRHNHEAYCDALKQVLETAEGTR